MKLLARSALLAGLAVLAVAGTALAGNHRNKLMTVNPPDGLTARVEYQGDVAPTLDEEARSPELAVAWSRSNSAPSTMLDRISADRDRPFDAMIISVGISGALAVDDIALVNWASEEALPADTARYSYVATSSGKGFCARSVEVTSEGRNQKPRIIAASSGQCDSAGGSAAAVQPSAPAHNT